MAYINKFMPKNNRNGNQGIQEFGNSTILDNNSLGVSEPKFLDPTTQPPQSQ